MINPSELRIGNWFLNGRSEPEKVENIYRDEINYSGHGSIEGCQDEYGWTEDEINPIPLTPEILEKCGFVKHKGNVSEGSVIWHYKYKFNPYNDDAPLINYVLLTIRHYTYGDEYIYETYFTLKHLHQLQNLFFALTGEELKVNF